MDYRELDRELEEGKEILKQAFDRAVDNRLNIDTDWMRAVLLDHMGAEVGSPVDMLVTGFALGFSEAMAVMTRQ